MDDNTKNELKTHLKEYCDLVLEPSKSGLYCCPFCGSGTGKHRTGAFSIFPKMEPVAYKCFSGDCGVTGDLFTLIMKIESVDFKEALRIADDLFGTGTETKAPIKKYQYQKPEQEQKQVKPTPPCKEWQRALIPIVQTAEKTMHQYQGRDAFKYLTEKRKIDRQTLEEFHIGYIPPISTEQWARELGYAYSINDPIPNSGRVKLGIPIGITLPYFMGGNLMKLETRRLDSQVHGEIDKIAQVRREDGIVKDAIFGGDYCTNKKVLDIMFVEGVIDALTVNQAVGRNCNNEIFAVTFGSSTTIGDADVFYRHYIMPRRVIVAFDNDEAGRKAGAELAAQITKARRYAKHPEPDAEIAFPPEKYKDWNEFYSKEPDAVFSYVSDLFPI